MKNSKIKTLKFSEDLVPLIISGEKTSTWRLFDDKDLQMDDELIFINKKTGKEFAVAKIISIKEKLLGEINENDFSGHEKFVTKEEMLNAYRTYYNDSVDESTVVKIINFEILRFLS